MFRGGIPVPSEMSATPHGTTTHTIVSGAVSSAGPARRQPTSALDPLHAPRQHTSGTRDGSRLDLVDLAFAALHQLMVVLHDLLHFLRILRVLPLSLHHRLERLHARHLHLRDDGPIPLSAEVSHDLHRRHARFGTEL